jgi:hypothetical protein
MEKCEACSKRWVIRNAYKIFVVNPQGKRHIWRSSLDVKMIYFGTGYSTVNWIGVAQNAIKLWAFVNTVMNLWVP